MRELEQRIRDDGFVIVPGGRHKHVRRADTGQLVMTLSVSSSDRRAVLNSWSDFRKARARPAR